MFVQVPKELPPQLRLRLPHQVLSQAQRDQQEVGPGEEPGAAGPEVLHKVERGVAINSIVARLEAIECVARLPRV